MIEFPFFKEAFLCKQVMFYNSIKQFSIGIIELILFSPKQSTHFISLKIILNSIYSNLLAEHKYSFVSVQQWKQKKSILFSNALDNLDFKFRERKTKRNALSLNVCLCMDGPKQNWGVNLVWFIVSSWAWEPTQALSFCSSSPFQSL